MQRRFSSRFVAHVRRAAWLLALLGGAQRIAPAADVRIVEVTSSASAPAAKLTFAFGGSGGALHVVAATVIAPAGCPIPTVTINTAQDTATLDWTQACIPVGQKVIFVASTPNAGPLTFANGSWSDATGQNIGAVAAGDVVVRNTDGGAHTTEVPIKPTVRSPGGTSGVQQIGKISVEAQWNGNTERCQGDFVFEAPRRWVDHGYDFRWVNLIVAYIRNGVPQANYPDLRFPHFPAIDPSPNYGAETDTDAPFYYTDATWAEGVFGGGTHEIHVECGLSCFRDHPVLPDGEYFFFKCFLVVDDMFDTQLGAREFAVLDGFSWYHNGVDTKKNGLVSTSPIAADVALIQNALTQGNQPFPTWTAKAGSACPLQAAPSAIGIQGVFQAMDTGQPNCAIFDWSVMNSGVVPIKRFHLDLEAGTGAQVCKLASDFILPGWNTAFCYAWDAAQPSNRAVLEFTSATALAPGQVLTGTATIDVNGANDVQVNNPNWHAFTVPAASVHVHATDYAPDCLAVGCATGKYGAHIAQDEHGRDQSAFWSAGDDWHVPPPAGTGACFGDGSSTLCPCGNGCAPGEGGCRTRFPGDPAGVVCPNFPFNLGTLLTASGSTSLSSQGDPTTRLVLTAHDTTTQPGLYFSGNTTIAGGAGVPFGDGLRCCGQGVVRHQLTDLPSTGPGINCPATGSTSVDLTSTGPPTSPGQKKCYQYWYRNPGSRSLCGNNFNLSNAVSVTWLP